VASDSTLENMNLLESYLKKQGRPLGFYTDKASLFQTAEKRKRDEPGVEKDAVEMPPTQIGRALRELAIPWIPAHSPRAKGRVERGFLTAQDRLVNGMRVAGVATLEQANRYLETEFLPWVNATLAVEPASADDAHRPLEKQHDLAAVLSHVEKPAREQRLHHPVGHQYLSDRAPGRPHRAAGRCRAGRFCRGWIPRPVSEPCAVCSAAQGSIREAGQNETAAQAGSAKRVEQEL